MARSPVLSTRVISEEEAWEVEAEGPGQELAGRLLGSVSGFGRPHNPGSRPWSCRLGSRALAPPTELLLRSGFILTRILDLVR